MGFEKGPVNSSRLFTQAVYMGNEASVEQVENAVSRFRDGFSELIHIQQMAPSSPAYTACKERLTAIAQDAYCALMGDSEVQTTALKEMQKARKAKDEMALVVANYRQRIAEYEAELSHRSDVEQTLREDLEILAEDLCDAREAARQPAELDLSALVEQDETWWGGKPKTTESVVAYVDHVKRSSYRREVALIELLQAERAVSAARQAVSDLVGEV